MKHILNLVKKFAAKEVRNPVVHTAWQAALGAVVAALSGTHGDVKAVVLVGVAAAAAAVKNSLVSPPAVDPSKAASGGSAS